jgi:UDP-glucose 4-epimerase
MTTRILLTGGFGNVGGRFSAFLAENKIEKLLLATRSRRNSPIWAPKSHVVRCDLLEPDSLKHACEGVNTIFHFAALNDRDSIIDPERAHAVNVVGTENLVEAAILNGVKHIVYMSTIHVYGAPLVGRINESSPTKPVHPYGLTHLAAEHVLRDHSTHVPTTVIRSGNGFGYPMSVDVDIWQILVNDLCLQAVRDQRMTLKSPSNIQRNFVTLRDICRALHYVGIERPNKVGSIVYNLGSVRSRTLLEMSNLIAERCEVILGFRPDVSHSTPDTNSETALDFDSSLLRSTGFTTEEHFESEIDGILNLLVASNG